MYAWKGWKVRSGYRDDPAGPGRLASARSFSRYSAGVMP